jgi:hypothetical protein
LLPLVSVFGRLEVYQSPSCTAYHWPTSGRTKGPSASTVGDQVKCMKAMAETRGLEPRERRRCGQSAISPSAYLACTMARFAFYGDRRAGCSPRSRELYRFQVRPSYIVSKRTSGRLRFELTPEDLRDLEGAASKVTIRGDRYPAAGPPLTNQKLASEIG